MTNGGIENRRFPRKDIKSRIPLRAIAQGHQGSVVIHGMDASSQGLGVLISGFFPPGSRLIVELSTWKLRLEVAWCHKDPFKNNLHRCGLRTVSDDVDLLQLLARAGCVLQ